jgi:hypothetical protein
LEFHLHDKISFSHLCYMSCLTYSDLSCWPNNRPSTDIIFAATTGTSIVVVSGGTEIPVGTFIPRNSTNVPANTVTVIRPFLNLTSFRGGITLDNGFFTVPCDGQYLVTLLAPFSNTAITGVNDYRALYIYKVDFYTQPQGLVTLVAKATTSPLLSSQVSSTDLTLSYIVNLRANDRIFVAATQFTREGDETNVNLSHNTRIAITRLK